MLFIRWLIAVTVWLFLIGAHLPAIPLNHQLSTPTLGTYICQGTNPDGWGIYTDVHLIVSELETGVYKFVWQGWGVGVGRLKLDELVVDVEVDGQAGEVFYTIRPGRLTGRWHIGDYWGTEDCKQGDPA